MRRRANPLLTTACVVAAALFSPVGAHAETPDDAVCAHLVSLSGGEDTEATRGAPEDTAECQAQLAELSDCEQAAAWGRCVTEAGTWLEAMACEPLCQGRAVEVLATAAQATAACDGLTALAKSLAGDAPMSEGMPQGSRCARRLLRDANRCAQPAELLRCTAEASTVEALVGCRAACFGEGWPASSAALADATVRVCDHVVPLARAAGAEHALDETLSRDVCVIGMVMEDDWCPHHDDWLACVEATASYDEVMTCKPICEHGAASATEAPPDGAALQAACENVLEIVKAEIGESGIDSTALGSVEACIDDLGDELANSCEQPSAALVCIRGASSLTDLMACQELCESTEPRVAVGAPVELAAEAREICAHVSTVAPELVAPDDSAAAATCAADVLTLAEMCSDWKAASGCMLAAPDRDAVEACLTHCGLVAP